MVLITVVKVLNIEVKVFALIVKRIYLISEEPWSHLIGCEMSLLEASIQASYIWQRQPLPRILQFQDFKFFHRI